MKFIHIYARYDRLGASSRVRIYQFVNKLSSIFRLQVNTLFPDNYVHNLYNNIGNSKLCILMGYVCRMWSLIFTRADVLWIEKELLPYMPYWLEQFLIGRKKVVLDIDDAWFHRYDLHPNWLVRICFHSKIYRMLGRADVVFAGSNYLYDTALACGAKNVVYMPTVVDLDKYKPSSRDVALDEIRIGWIGSKTTVLYLDLILDVLTDTAKLFADKKIKFYVIGAELNCQIPNVEIIHLPWSEENEINFINQTDIGIMPLYDSLWEQGKCAYKLIQYMACGKAVVASGVGQNLFVIEHGVDGFLCNEDEEWVKSLSLLISDVKLREQMGLAGYKKIQSNYNVTNNVSFMQNIFGIV